MNIKKHMVPFSTHSRSLHSYIFFFYFSVKSDKFSDLRNCLIESFCVAQYVMKYIRDFIKDFFNSLSNADFFTTFSYYEEENSKLPSGLNNQQIS